MSAPTAEAVQSPIASEELQPLQHEKLKPDAIEAKAKQTNELLSGYADKLRGREKGAAKRTVEQLERKVNSLKPLEFDASHTVYASLPEGSKDLVLEEWRANLHSTFEPFDKFRGNESKETREKLLAVAKGLADESTGPLPDLASDADEKAKLEYAAKVLGRNNLQTFEEYVKAADIKETDHYTDVISKLVEYNSKVSKSNREALKIIKGQLNEVSNGNNENGLSKGDELELDGKKWKRVYSNPNADNSKFDIDKPEYLVDVTPPEKYGRDEKGREHEYYKNLHTVDYNETGYINNAEGKAVKIKHIEFVVNRRETPEGRIVKTKKAAAGTKRAVFNRRFTTPEDVGELKYILGNAIIEEPQSGKRDEDRHVRLAVKLQNKYDRVVQIPKSTYDQLRNATALAEQEFIKAGLGDQIKYEGDGSLSLNTANETSLNRSEYEANQKRLSEKYQTLIDSLEEGHPLRANLEEAQKGLDNIYNDFLATFGNESAYNQKALYVLESKKEVNPEIRNLSKDSERFKALLAQEVEAIRTEYLYTATVLGLNGDSETFIEQQISAIEDEKDVTYALLNLDLFIKTEIKANAASKDPENSKNKDDERARLLEIAAPLLREPYKTPELRQKELEHSLRDHASTNFSEVNLVLSKHKLSVTEEAYLDAANGLIEEASDTKDLQKDYKDPKIESIRPTVEAENAVIETQLTQLKEKQKNDNPWAVQVELANQVYALEQKLAANNERLLSSVDKKVNQLVDQYKYNFGEEPSDEIKARYRGNVVNEEISLRIEEAKELEADLLGPVAELIVLPPGSEENDSDFILQNATERVKNDAQTGGEKNLIKLISERRRQDAEARGSKVIEALTPVLEKNGALPPVTSSESAITFNNFNDENNSDTFTTYENTKDAEIENDLAEFEIAAERTRKENRDAVENKNAETILDFEAKKKAAEDKAAQVRLQNEQAVYEVDSNIGLNIEVDSESPFTSELQDNEEYEPGSEFAPIEGSETPETIDSIVLDESALESNFSNIELKESPFVDEDDLNLPEVVSNSAVENEQADLEVLEGDLIFNNNPEQAKENQAYRSYAEKFEDNDSFGVSAEVSEPPVEGNLESVVQNREIDEGDLASESDLAGNRTFSADDVEIPLPEVVDELEDTDSIKNNDIPDSVRNRFTNAINNLENNSVTNEEVTEEIPEDDSSRDWTRSSNSV